MPKGNNTLYTGPFRSFNFNVEIEGLKVAQFVECDGIDIKIDAIKYREAGMNQQVHRLPGFVDYGDVVLQYGLTSDRQLFDWFLEIAAGKTVPRQVSIVTLNNEGTSEAFRLNLENAFPIEWKGAKYNTTSSGLAVEMMKLTFERIKRENAGA